MDVKGKKWEKYIERKKSEKFERLKEIVRELHGRVWLEIRNGKMTVRVKVRLPAHKVKRKNKYGYVFWLDRKYRNISGFAYVWIVPVKWVFEKKEMICSVVDVEVI